MKHLGVEPLRDLCVSNINSRRTALLSFESGRVVFAAASVRFVVSELKSFFLIYLIEWLLMVIKNDVRTLILYLKE